MTSNELIGLAWAGVFAAFVGTCIYYTTKWGAETKKREEEFEKAQSVEVMTEEGDTLTILRQADAPSIT